MRVSAKAEYGLLALVDLGLHGGEAPVQVADIAKRQNIPKQFLDQVLIAMKSAGLVTSSRGRQGGYRLARPASAITLLDALRALDGPLLSRGFQGRSARGRKARAVLKRVWAEASTAAESTLRGTTLEDVLAECGAMDPADMYVI